MPNGIRRRLSYANVMATLAVFLAVAGGAAWALSRNSVGSREIKDGSVKLRDLGDIKFRTVKVSSSASDDDNATARLAAKRIVLFKRGPLTVYGKCFHDTGIDQAFGVIYARTKKDGTILNTDAASGDDLVGAPDYLDRDTPEVDREINRAQMISGSASTTPPGREVLLLAPGRKPVYGESIAYAKHEVNPPGGAGAWGAGNRCVLGFHVIG